MPAFAHDPHSGIRLFVSAALQGRIQTDTEMRRRHRAGHKGLGHGVPDPIFTALRNGLPDHKPYIWQPPPDDPENEARAVWAWQTVANIQAQLRGEPPPGPAGVPWDKAACPRCGYTIRCRCEVTA